MFMSVYSLKVVKAVLCASEIAHLGEILYGLSHINPHSIDFIPPDVWGGCMPKKREKRREKVLIVDLEETLVNKDGLVKGAANFLSKASSDFVLVLLTNHTRKKMDEILNSYLLRPYFDLVISAAEYEMKKPDPRIIGVIRAMLKDKLGYEFDPDNFWIIGDRVDRDILLGNRAGIKTIRARWGKYAEQEIEFEEETPAYEATSFSEVLEILGLRKRKVKSGKREKRKTKKKGKRS